MTPLWAPLNEGFIQNPYGAYQRLREEDPVHQAQTGEWIITRYHDIKTILKSDAVRSGNRLEWISRGIHYLQNRDEELRFIMAAINSFILFLNPPDHMLIRNFVGKAWSNRDASNLITRNAAFLLNRIQPKEFDLVKDYALPLPVMTMATIMGIPEEDHRHLTLLGNHMLLATNPYPSYKELALLNEASAEFIGYFKNLIRDKTQHPDDSLISKLIRNNSSGVLREEHLISVCIFLFIAGEETTTNGISAGLYHLLQRPGVVDYVQAHPEKYTQVIEELLRYDPPVHLLGRITNSEVNIGGKKIPAESYLTLVIASGNRDADVFENPDELNPERSPNHHLTFGSGVHFCMGDWLARIQIRIAIESFLKRFSTASISPQPVTWNKNPAIRGMTSLHVIVNGQPSTASLK